MLTEQEEGKVRNIIDAFDNGKSVTELNAATSLGNNDVMEVLQGGENKKVPVSVVKESVNSDVLTDLNKRGVFNVTVSVPLTAGSYYTLSTAIAAVPTASKTLGLDLKFSTAANTWVVYRYKGSDLTGWATTTNWEQVPDAAKLSSLETDLNELELKVGLQIDESYFKHSSYIDRFTGEDTAGSSGFITLSLDVKENEIYHVHLKNTFANASVISFYDSNGYNASISIVGVKTLDQDVSIPSGVTRVTFGSKIEEGRISYIQKKVYTSIDREQDITKNTNKIDGLISSLGETYTDFNKIGYVNKNTGVLNTGVADTFRYLEFDVFAGEVVEYKLAVVYSNAMVLALYSDGIINQNSKSSQGLTIISGSITIPEGVNLLRACVQLDTSLGNDFFISIKNIATVADILSVDDEYFGNIPQYCDFAIGRDSILFLDNIGKISNTTENQFSIRLDGSAPSGYSNTKKIIKFTPSVKSNFDVTFVKYANVYHEKCRKKTIFRPIQRNIGVGQTKNIIFIGDSLISSGDSSAKVYELLNEDGDFNINMLGSHEVGNKINSGHGSWSWETWTNPSGENTPIYGQLNEFFHNGVLDFKYFMQNRYPSLSGIDIAVISLGTNDVGQNGTDGEKFVADKIESAIENAKVFITALLADYPNIKVAIGLPSPGAYFSCGYKFYPDGFRAAIVKYGAKMVNTFDNGKWHPNVTCVYHGWYIDPANDYPYSTITDYNGNEYKVIRNFIHPSEIGYQHLGIGYYNKIRAFLSGVL